MTFSNWVMLMSLHKCARTMCLGTLRLLSHGSYGETAVERMEERGRREEEEGWEEAFYTPRNMRTFPKWTVPLHLPNPYTDICLHGEDTHGVSEIIISSHTDC